MHTKRQRLAEIYRRLRAAPPTATDEEALALLGDVMNAVENELSGVPYDSDEATMLVVSKRMYPPLADMQKPTTIVGVRRFNTVQHEILVGLNGAS